MRRIEEKVKDIVDVQPYGSVIDFRADPVLTVTSYHFTDTTADLMSKWLARANDVRENSGASLSLAGFRGVGKSHFLATLGVLLGNSEIRVRVREPLVETALRTLQRRQFAVGSVRRGTGTTLLDEVKEGLAHIIGVDQADLSNNLSEILMQATMNTAGETVVLVIDTALERTERVSRDDGPVLTEIASIAKQLGIFVALALDDDIAGADGANAGIGAEYSIDYLDQEHLYRIVDSKVFPKEPRMLPALNRIYEHYRSVLPGFRWSEQRFTALYPLHPTIMEIAPFVRLYLPEFALLGFASEAGSRILGRPANSLIAPDEVFDNVEKGLRGVEDLEEVFVAFDSLNSTVVAKTPVMKRLQAKLILKGLFLLSLNEGGATADEIAASMLIFDENSPVRAVSEVEGILRAFAAALPDSVQVTHDSGDVARFSFRLAGKDDLRRALVTAAEAIGESESREVLRRVMSERFSDCTFSTSDDGHEVSTDSFVVWRGSNRPGRIFWGNRVSDSKQRISEWEVVIDTAAFYGDPIQDVNGRIYWRPAKLTDEEDLVIKRLAALNLNSQLRSDFKESIAAAIQAQTNAAEKVLTRSLLIDGVLVIDGLEYNFTDEARTSSSLSQISTLMLESLFEGRFPMHPYFPQVLGMREVSSLVSDFFSGTQSSLDESQWLASTFAVQLDLAVKVDDRYAPADADRLAENQLVKRVMTALPQDGSNCNLEVVFDMLAEPPYGLVREAGYLLLAGMASARMLEFVTNSGDRISRRSFDLQIIWEDVVAVAIPLASTYTSARLGWWAGQVCGTKISGSIESADVRNEVTELLASWLSDWETLNLGGQFDSLGDSQYNARFWRMASISIRSFNVVADAVRGISSGSVSLEACLERIADTFSDSEAEFIARRNDLEAVKNFISTAAIREAGRLYISLCEYTDNAVTDSLRCELEEMFDRSARGDAAITKEELKIKLDLFKRTYCELYSEEHDRAVRSRETKDKISEISQTGIWREYQSVKDLSFFDVGYKRTIQELYQRIGDLDCHFDAMSMASESGSCGCRFSLSGIESFEHWPNELWAAVNRGLSDFRRTLSLRSGEIVESILKSDVKGDPELVEGANAIRKTLTSGDSFSGLTDPEIRVLQFADERIEENRRNMRQAILSSSNASDAPLSDLSELLVALDEH